MPDSLLTGCRALAEAAGAGDHRAFGLALSAVHQAIPGAGPADRRGATVFLGDHIERLAPRFASWAAVLAGVLIERGGDPAPAAAPILACLKTTAEAATYFAVVWREVTDEPLPDPDGVPTCRIHRLLEPELADATPTVMEAWSSLPRWSAAARIVLVRCAEARRECADTPQLLRAVTAAAEYCPTLREVRTLLPGPAGARRGPGARYGSRRSDGPRRSGDTGAPGALTVVP